MNARVRLLRQPGYTAPVKQRGRERDDPLDASRVQRDEEHPVGNRIRNRRQGPTTGYCIREQGESLLLGNPQRPTCANRAPPPNVHTIGTLFRFEPKLRPRALGNRWRPRQDSHPRRAVGETAPGGARTLQETLESILGGLIRSPRKPREKHAAGMVSFWHRGSVSSRFPDSPGRRPEMESTGVPECRGRRPCHWRSTGRQRGAR